MTDQTALQQYEEKCAPVCGWPKWVGDEGGETWLKRGGRVVCHGCSAHCRRTIKRVDTAAIFRCPAAGIMAFSPSQLQAVRAKGKK